MAARSPFLISLALVLVLISNCSLITAYSGTATFYSSYDSYCYGNKNQGVMIAAASDALGNKDAACGHIYNVTCVGPTNAVPHPCTSTPTVTVKIVDYCPGCGGTIDLSKEAFAKIANPVAGVIKIEYNRIK
ncbi:putative EG45-like domain containing protein 1 isoform X2 [Papaver somniferum]|uniref:putative EG45-like domain containing protein 1 isoform X2 n=1 Tax=Papaver somniferum TaxID=3469 RepID=UPI000E6FD060|nr:putative EG45-like domain containing protein 1 isoform X2 [Papaver somniferum]